jgi:hypothetical protein
MLGKSRSSKRKPLLARTNISEMSLVSACKDQASRAQSSDHSVSDCWTFLTCSSFWLWRLLRNCFVWCYFCYIWSSKVFAFALIRIFQTMDLGTSAAKKHEWCDLWKKIKNLNSIAKSDGCCPAVPKICLLELAWLDKVTVFLPRSVVRKCVIIF